MTVERNERLTKVMTGMFFAAGLLALPLSASAQSGTGGILFEDYRGTADVPTGSPTPNFNNRTRTINGTTNIQRLLALQGLPDAVAESGKRSQIDWLGANPELCDTQNIGRNSESSRAACAKWKMGRIAYTVIRFPVEGAVQFRVAHDDDLKVDFSDQITIGAGYRNATWNFQVGTLASYYAENQWMNLGQYTSPQVGSCVLARFVWVNNGGLNHLRLRYRTTNFNSGINDATGNRTFSPSDFIDPTDTDTIRSSCTGVIAAPELQLRKEIEGGRIKADDQFRLNVRTASSVILTSDTSGTGTTHVLPVANLTASSDKVFIEELPLGGAVLTDYSPTARCTKTTTNNPTPVNVPLTATSGSADGYSWQMNPPAAGEKVSCTITNTRPKANLALTKTSSVPADTVMRTGDAVTYTLTARNTGPAAAHGSVIRDPAVPGISCSANSTVSCQASGNAVCPAQGSRTVGNLQGAGLTIPTFPSGGTITLGFTCNVTASGY